MSRRQKVSLALERMALTMLKYSGAEDTESLPEVARDDQYDAHRIARAIDNFLAPHAEQRTSISWCACKRCQFLAGEVEREKRP